MLRKKKYGESEKGKRKNTQGWKIDRDATIVESVEIERERKRESEGELKRNREK